MRRGATKVPKSNSMNEARMSEILTRSDLRVVLGASFHHRDGRDVPRKQAWIVRKLPPCATPHDTASVPRGAI